MIEYLKKGLKTLFKDDVIDAEIIKVTEDILELLRNLLNCI